MQGWSSVWKCQTIADLIYDLGGDSFEIGIFAGRSLLSMAMAHRARKGGKVFGIDPFCHSASLMGENTQESNERWKNLDYERIKRLLVQSISQFSLGEWIEWYQVDSFAAIELNWVKDKKFNVIHQDGNHSEKVCLWEVQNWGKKLNLGGYWVMDDTNWETTSKAQQWLENNGYKRDQTVTEGNTQWAVFKKCAK